jgi:hypothetical protein
MFDPVSMGIMAALYHGLRRLQNSHSSSSSTTKCVITGCGCDAAKVTNCCQAPLCSAHLSQWQRDPNPCPCRK